MPGCLIDRTDFGMRPAQALLLKGLDFCLLSPGLWETIPVSLGQFDTLAMRQRALEEQNFRERRQIQLAWMIFGTKSVTFMSSLHSEPNPAVLSR